MERLTRRDSVGQALLAPEWEEKYKVHELIDILLECLAAYEDTGLEPEEVRHWKECIATPTMKHLVEMCGKIEAERDRYKKAEADGRLVVLPCKVGEPCFRIYTCRCGCRERCKKKKEAKLIDVVHYPYANAYVYYCKRIAESKFTLKDIANFGNTVFLSREEAEAALKERGST